MLRTATPLALVLVAAACGDDVGTADTDDGTSTGMVSSTGGTSSGPGSTTTGPSDTSSSTGAAEESSSSGPGEASSSSGTLTDGSTSSGGAVTCGVPKPPLNGVFEDDCEGAAIGEVCVLTCENGTNHASDAECGDDGEWSGAACDDPFDQDGDGQRRYPWGPDLDDDADGERTYLLGGDDYDDTDAGATALSGDGTFVLLDSYDLGVSAGPTGVASGDWNNDGNADLATSNQNNDTISVFTGGGDASFSSSQVIALPKEGGGGRMKPIDFDGDGNLDLVATFACRIFMGQGDGTFADSGLSPGPCTYLEVIDANGDGRLDIVHAAGPDVVVFVAQDDGSFVSIVSTQPDTNAQGVAAGFIDGDETLDLILVEADDWSADVLLGAGDGSFTAGGGLADASYYNAVATPRDMTGDGNADVIVGDFINNTISLIAGDGAGQLGATASVVIDGPFADGLFAGDLDADGNADIVYASQTVGFGAAMGTGGGAFAAPWIYEADPSPLVAPFGLAAADFNGDGRMDFGVIDISGDSLHVMVGQ